MVSRINTMLTGCQLAEFETKGFTIVRNAFSSDIAKQIREELLWPLVESDGTILKNNSNTWPYRKGLKDILQSDDQVISNKLIVAIDQLLGESCWDIKTLALGWWVVTFPESCLQTTDLGVQPTDLETWGARGKWHVDGAHFLHSADSPEQGLLPVFLFSNIEAGDGGTALAVGSHLRVAQLLLEESDGIPGGDLSQRAREIPGILNQVEEVTGNAGDVALLHPFLLHAISRNLGNKGVDSVRFICNPCVRLKNSMDIRIQNESFASPLERTIINVRKSLKLNDTITQPTFDIPPRKRRKQKSQRKK